MLKFDLTPVMGMTINGATFFLTSDWNHNDAPFVHNVYSSSDDTWSEATVNGVNRPVDSTLTFLDSRVIGGVFETCGPFFLPCEDHSWNVTSGVAGSDGVGGASAFFTLLIRPDLSQAGTGGVTGFGPHFFDRTGTNYEQYYGQVVVPRLIIEASPVPLPAAIWALGGGLAMLTGVSRRRRTVAG